MSADAIFAAELLQLTESVGELRIIMDLLRRRIEGLEAQMADTRREWLPGLDRRIVALEGDSTTATPVPEWDDD